MVSKSSFSPINIAMGDWQIPKSAAGSENFTDLFPIFVFLRDHFEQLSKNGWRHFFFGGIELNTSASQTEH